MRKQLDHHKSDTVFICFCLTRCRNIYHKISHLASIAGKSLRPRSAARFRVETVAKQWVEHKYCAEQGTEQGEHHSDGKANIEAHSS